MKLKKCLFSIMAGMFFSAVPEFANSVTLVGDKLEMLCGQHKIVLTCGHSIDIANRQRISRYKGSIRLCNDNTVEFIAKNGSFKKFSTYSSGQYKDSTPVRLFCRVPKVGKEFQVAILIENTAEFSRFIAGFSEDGTILFDDKSIHLIPSGYAYFHEMPGEAGYFDEYFKGRPRSRMIEIEEGR